MNVPHGKGNFADIIKGMNFEIGIESLIIQVHSVSSLISLKADMCLDEEKGRQRNAEERQLKFQA